MGATIPQVLCATESGASGAQVIDGSLTFDKATKRHLARTPGTAGNQKTWTLSLWFNKQNLGDQRILFNAFDDNSNRVIIRMMSDKLQFALQTGGTFYGLQTNQVFRDNGWYHVVLVLDTTQSTDTERQKIYVNGNRIADGDLTHNSISGTNKYPTQNSTFTVNNTDGHYIGANYESGSLQDTTWDGHISQVYLIDGLALGPGYFGFTDALTNTWRPKKFEAKGTTVNDGRTFSSIGTFTNWDDDGNYPKTELFDGTIYTGGTPDGACPDDGNPASFDFGDQRITGFQNLQINIFISSNQVNATGLASVNGVDITREIHNAGNNTWTTVDLGNKFTTLQSFTIKNNNCYVGGFIIDGVVVKDATVQNLDFGTNGFYLPLDGKTPIGHDKSRPNPINNGTIWSSGAGSNFETARPASFGFNGDPETFTRTNNGNVTATVTLPQSVPFTTLKIRGARDSGNGTITVNGVDVSSQFTSSSATLETVTITGVTSPLTSIALTGISGSAQPRYAQIIVDDVVLTDGIYGNGFEPVHFGGSVSLDNPQVSGAKPILNTTQGGTQAEGTVFGENVGQTYTVTASGGKYYLDGTVNPMISMIRGATYVFDYSAASSHPFRFATAADAAGGTQYTNGVDVTGNVTSITVPHNAPDTLYYYCTAHSGMGNSISVTTDETLTDIYASNCVLAMPLVGDKHDLSNSINCTSTTKVITNNGANISKVPGNFYNGSFNWDGGTTDRLTVTYNSEFQFGTDDFCVEFWVNLSTSSGNQYFFDFDTNGGVLQYNGNVLSYSDGFVAGSGPLYSTGVSLPIGKWVHLAVTRESGIGRIFVDGIIKASGHTTYNYNQTSVLDIGNGYNNSGYEITGYMQDFRMYKGVAKYTSNFVVPSTNPDFLPDTPSGVVGNSKLEKITEGAVSFDGNNYLFAGSSSDYNFGTGDFTIEGYFYFDNTTGSPNDGLWQISANPGGLQAANSTLSCNYETSGGRNRQLYFGSTGGWRQSGNDYEFLPFMWNHVAEVRSSGVISIYINGKLSQSWSDTSNYGMSECAIGAYYSTSYRWNGYISNFRVVNGTAVYTSEFTPPTEPLTNITNTKLLCCKSPNLAGAASVAPRISGINDGIVWSEESTITPPSSGFNSGGGIAQAFDGSTSSMASGAGGRSETFVIDFARDITVSTSLEVYMSSGASQFKVNDGSFSSSLNNGAWRSLSFTGTLSKLTVKGDEPQTYGNFAPRLAAIRIDGSTILIDPITQNDDLSPTTLNPFNTDINTVRGQETGYPTINPLYPNPNGTGTLSNGNLTHTTAAGNGQYNATMAIPPNSGKFYWEVTKQTSSNVGMIGITDMDLSLPGYNANNVGSFSWYIAGPRKQTSGVDTNYGSSVSEGDVVGVAYDSDARELRFYLNGADQGVAFDSSSIGEADYFPAFSAGSSSTVFTYSVNFGQKPFKFPPPEGFQPLNIANFTREETVITRPDKYFGNILYKGTGNTSGRLIEGLNFNAKPDLIWVKNRGEAVDHILYDSLRGFGANKELVPNDTYSEGQTGGGAPNTQTWGYVKSNNTNGFTVQSGSSGQSVVNNSAINYVAWCWKAGGNKNTFNVDDVGYASASDVDMGVGDLNSVALNQTQNWTSKISWAAGGWNGAGTAPFDNDPTNYDYSSQTRANNGRATLDISSLTGSRVITVIAEQTEVTLNHAGGSTTFTPPNTSRIIHTFEPVMNPTSIEFIGLNSGSFMVLIGVYVDGARLVNSGVSATNVPSIAATGCSVGTKQGFSIVKYNSGSSGTGTIPHGLSETPTFAMIKTTGTTSDWSVYHKELGQNRLNNYLVLNTTAGSASATNIWGEHPPSPHYFGVKSGTTTATSQDCVGYFWHDVPGLQKFGKYNGLDGSNGPYVELGFRPALIIFKRFTSDHSNGGWYIYDSSRDSHNTAYNFIVGESPYAERRASNNSSFVSTYYVDFLSNGFKLRHDSTNLSVSGTSYIYAAWAEAPSINLYGAQSNAR